MRNYRIWNIKLAKGKLNSSLPDSKLNCRLVPNGIRLLPVKRMEHRILLYMYRPGKLEEDFRNHEAEA